MDKPTFLTMTKNLAMPRNDIPTGSFVCAGDTLLSCLDDSKIPLITNKLLEICSTKNQVVAL